MYIHAVPELALLVRDRRKALGLSQAALATRIGASRQWVVAFEGGRPNVELAPVLRALRALGLTIAVSPANAPPGQRESSQPVGHGGQSPRADRRTSSMVPVGRPPASPAARLPTTPTTGGRQPTARPDAIPGALGHVLDRLRPPPPPVPRTGR